MTPAKDVLITICSMTVKISDLHGWTDRHVILTNGMKIEASRFEINKARRMQFAALGQPTPIIQERER